MTGKEHYHLQLDEEARFDLAYKIFNHELLDELSPRRSTKERMGELLGKQCVTEAQIIEFPGEPEFGSAA